jgi:hypothetical protein
MQRGQIPLRGYTFSTAEHVTFSDLYSELRSTAVRSTVPFYFAAFSQATRHLQSCEHFTATITSVM